MSGGFSADWLALREPYDAAACSEALVGRLAAWAGGRERLRILDLGAGTGAQLRRLAPCLGPGQDWTLVELDPALIAAGTADLAAVTVPWRYRRLDLARELEVLAAEPVDLIAASALLDLVAEPWLDRLLALRQATGAALYLALGYDGRIAWEPALPDDTTATDLVNRHQRTDKGFGPALGPEAAPMLHRLLPDALVATSDWCLGADDRAMQTALLEGYVEAGLAMAAPAGGPAVVAWGERRRRLIAEGCSRLWVGHLDLLFLPAR
jgi:hypothetical protein